MTTLTCLWCPYTETGEGYEPHDRLAEHYLRCLARAKPCGCHLGGRNRTDVWTCDQHASAFLRERTVWRLANWAAGGRPDHRRPAEQ